MAQVMARAMAQDVRGLAAIRVNKVELLKKIRECREKHAADYAEALEGYHNRVVLELTKALKEAKDGKAYRTHFNLPEPESHLADYDRVIAMLDMSLDVEIDLPADEFSKYALNEWEWMRAFNQTKAVYASSAR